jgi:hypothetical protein
MTLWQFCGRRSNSATGIENLIPNSAMVADQMRQNRSFDARIKFAAYAALSIGRVQHAMDVTEK